MLRFPLRCRPKTVTRSESLTIYRRNLASGNSASIFLEYLNYLFRTALIQINSDILWRIRVARKHFTFVGMFASCSMEVRWYFAVLQVYYVTVLNVRLNECSRKVLTLRLSLDCNFVEDSAINGQYLHGNAYTQRTCKFYKYITMILYILISINMYWDTHAVVSFETTFFHRYLRQILLVIS